MSAELRCLSHGCPECERFAKSGGFITGVWLENAIVFGTFACVIVYTAVFGVTLLGHSSCLVIMAAVFSYRRLRYSVHFIENGVAHSHRVLKGWWGFDDTLHAWDVFFGGDGEEISRFLCRHVAPSAVVTIDSAGNCDVRIPEDPHLLVTSYTFDGYVTVVKREGVVTQSIESLLHALAAQTEPS